MPFANTDEHDNWSTTHLTEATGFSSFDEYKEIILNYRRNLFQKLLKQNDKAKTIFCFGKSYKKDFIFALTGEKDTNNKPAKILKHSETPVFTYEINSSQIRKIIICHFPYGFNDEDWQEISDLAKE